MLNEANTLLKQTQNSKINRKLNQYSPHQAPPTDYQLAVCIKLNFILK